MKKEERKSKIMLQVLIFLLACSDIAFSFLIKNKTFSIVMISFSLVLILLLIIMNFKKFRKIRFKSKEIESDSVEEYEKIPKKRNKYFFKILIILILLAGLALASFLVYKYSLINIALQVLNNHIGAPIISLFSSKLFYPLIILAFSFFFFSLMNKIFLKEMRWWLIITLSLMAGFFVFGYFFLGGALDSNVVKLNLYDSGELISGSQISCMGQNGPISLGTINCKLVTNLAYKEVYSSVILFYGEKNETKTYQEDSLSFEYTPNLTSVYFKTILKEGQVYEILQSDQYTFSSSGDCKVNRNVFINSLLILLAITLIAIPLGMFIIMKLFENFKIRES